MGFVRKNISITKEQEEFIKKENLNLSRLVQESLNKKLKGGKK